MTCIVYYLLLLLLELVVIRVAVKVVVAEFCYVLAHTFSMLEMQSRNSSRKFVDPILRKFGNSLLPLESTGSSVAKTSTSFCCANHFHASFLYSYGTEGGRSGGQSSG